MSREVRERLDAKAKKLGFDSAQTYIGVWAEAEADHTLSFNDDWGQPTPKAAARLNRLADEACADSDAGKLTSYYSVDDFLTDLRHAEGH